MHEQGRVGLLADLDFLDGKLRPQNHSYRVLAPL
jgi:hypothetical protein